jgi:hypothetical protein
MEFSKSNRALEAKDAALTPEELTQILTMLAEPSIDFWESTSRAFLAQIAISLQQSSADRASRS